MQESRKMPRLMIVFALFCFRPCFLLAQTAPPENPTVQEARKLADEQRWQDLILLLGPLHSRSAEMDFYYGTALARLERWSEAENAFQAGRRLAPDDARFPIELAGAAFKQKHYPQAAYLLRRAIKLTPQDAYANDFLGTVYFLEGNLEASLKYWNRVGKPRDRGNSRGSFTSGFSRASRSRVRVFAGRHFAVAGAP